MKRLFFGLWPNEQQRQACSDVMAQIPNSAARKVNPTNLHVTLLFLGNVSADQQQFMMNGADRLVAPNGVLIFDALHYWRKPGVLCLSSQQFDVIFTQLVQELTDMAKQAAIVIDERAFNPHVTLARAARENATVSFKPIHWSTTGFCLLESCQQPGGVVYKILKEWSNSQL